MRHQPPSLLRRISLATVCSLVMTGSAPAVSISKDSHEGRAHYRITTSSAVYYYDCSGGGFSRIIDRDGKDWISFRKEPLKTFPAAAAAGFRGMPNMVFGRDDPDSGAGHPGFDVAMTEQVGPDTLMTTSLSGRWSWRWTFTENRAELSIERVDPGRSYWFLYEGTVGGRWSPATHYWGTDAGGPRRERPSRAAEAITGRWRWCYFGDDASPRVLLVAQASKDDVDDAIWYMGSTPAGIEAPDGMIVFGFGRGAGSRPLMRGAGRRFVVGFLEEKVVDPAGHAGIAARISGWFGRDSAGP